MYQTIVVGTDLSESASKALTHAAALARLSGAKVHLVCAFKPALSVGIAAAGAVYGADVVLEAERNLTDEVSAQLRLVQEKLAADGITATVHAIAGDPADALLDVAESTNADLIVVGNRGMGGVKRFVLGSVPNKISHHAPCSVLIVETS